MRWLTSRFVALLALLMDSAPGRVAGRRISAIEYGWGPSVMSELRKAWILFRHRHANLQFGEGVHVGRGFSLHMPSSASTLIIGKGTDIRNGVRIELHGKARVVIGADCVLSYNVLIQCLGSIEMGDNSGLAQSCAVYDGNHVFRGSGEPFMNQGFDLRPIKIGKGCGVLSKTTIVNDVGDYCAIGANSVVTKPIPSHCLAAGVPAKVLEYYGPPGEEPDELVG